METRNNAIDFGFAVLHDPARNKGSAFSEAERDRYHLRGLLPPQVQNIERQVSRVMLNLERAGSALNRYMFLSALQARNETLFYRMLIDYIEQLMPLVYTPTVGEACQEFGHIFQQPHGLYITAEDAGRVAQVLANWTQDDVRCVVVTDGERILGLGDLGANGMGIPLGKLALYTACGGVAPRHCLPIMLDVGTHNQTLLADPLYLGLHQQRIARAAYDALIEEFLLAVSKRYPRALIQFEDFGNQNAFRLLHQYRNEYCVFNDDIQGTGAVALAGILAASRLANMPLHEQTLLFYGAGEAGIGIADMVVSAMCAAGLSEAEARARCWFIDSRGLVVAERTDLVAHKRRYAHQHPRINDLYSAIGTLRPNILIGVSGEGKAFTPSVLTEMGRINQQPIIFALSNPTSHAECNAVDAYTYTEGRAIFASGSPFEPVHWGGRVITPGQGNNVYIFPGIGLAVSACGIQRVTDEMVLAAARALAAMTTSTDFTLGRVYPALSRIREVSLAVAQAVAVVAYAQGWASGATPADLAAHLQQAVYRPAYD